MHTVMTIKFIFFLATIQCCLLIYADNTFIFWFVVYLRVSTKLFMPMLRDPISGILELFGV